MMAKCPTGHSENLTHRELAHRLRDGDFECREDDCSKKMAYEVDHVFHKEYMTGLGIE